MLGLRDKDFKAPILNTCIELNTVAMFKEIKESMTTMIY